MRPFPLKSENKKKNNFYHILLSSQQFCCRAWWLIGRFVAFRPKGCGFESRSIRHAGTFGKSFTHSFLWRFGVKLRHSICAVSGEPLSNSGLEEAL